MDIHKNSFQQMLIKILGFVLFVGFVVASILVLIIGQGNIISISDRDIIQTGAIKIRSNVDDYQAYINDQKVSISDDRIENLKPGQYTLRIEKEDFSAWENIVNVNSGLITTVTAQLFSSEINLKQIVTETIQNPTFSDDRNYMYYVIDSSSEKNNGIWRKSLKESDLSIIDSSKLKIAELDFLGTDEQILDTKISPDNESLLVITNVDYYFLSAEKFNADKEIESFDFQDLKIKNIEWFDDSEKVLINTSENVLLTFNLENSEKILITIFKDDPQYQISSSKDVLCFVNSGKLKIFENKSESELNEDIQLKLEEKTISEVHFCNKDVSLLSVDNDTVAYINQEYDFVQFFPNSTLVTADLELESFIAQTNNISFSNIVETSNLNNSVTISTKKSLLPYNSDIKTIKWAEDGSFLVFKATNSNLSNVLFAADRRGNNITKLIEFNEGATLSSNFVINTSEESIILFIQGAETLDLLAQRLELVME